MCIVSNIGDSWKTDRAPLYPWAMPPGIFPGIPVTGAPGPSIEEFNALKAELEELKKSLIVAKKQDEADGNPDCEMEEKIELLRALGELMGVDFNEVFKES